MAAQGVTKYWCMIQSVSVRSHPPRNWIVLSVLVPSHVHLWITHGFPASAARHSALGISSSSKERGGEQKRALARVGVVERYR